MAGSAMEQGERALKWLEQQLSAQTCHSWGCAAVNAAPVVAATLAPELIPEEAEGAGIGRTLWDILADESGSIPAGGGTGAASGLGDITVQEIEQIQNVVDQAGRPIYVAGSAARGAREVGSDIDYVVPPSSLKYFDDLLDQLPSLDVSHGLIPGVPNPNMGPTIPFYPRVFP